MPHADELKCLVCDQVFRGGHRCPFAGVDHANMHREMMRRITLLEDEVRELRSLVTPLDRGLLPGRNEGGR